MSDPRLNSLHLKPERKEDFRAARDVVLQARGEKTLKIDSDSALQARKDPPTAIVPSNTQLPPQVRFVLVDHDLIHPLKVGINTVGRMPDNDVVVADPYVSRRHVAILVHANNTCELYDVASRNGTLLNGQPIDGPTALKSGDCIQLSDHQLVFLCQEKKQNEHPTENTHLE